jgi:hypothetical protein
MNKYSSDQTLVDRANYKSKIVAYNNIKNKQSMRRGSTVHDNAMRYKREAGEFDDEDDSLGMLNQNFNTLRMTNLNRMNAINDNNSISYKLETDDNINKNQPTSNKFPDNELLPNYNSDNKLNCLEKRREDEMSLENNREWQERMKECPDDELAATTPPGNKEARSRNETLDDSENVPTDSEYGAQRARTYGQPEKYASLNKNGRQGTEPKSVRLGASLLGQFFFKK